MIWICENVYNTIKSNQNPPHAMQYIPESRIRVNSYLDILSTLPLNNDVCNYISEYATSYIDPSVSKDQFWLSLGAETRRLFKMAYYCWQIIGNSYGRPASFTKKFQKVLTFGDALQSELDDLICGSYPLNVYTIDSHDGPVSIVSVFYTCHDNIEPFPVKYIKKVRGHTFRKSITLSEKQYIVAFISKLDEYITYIEKTLTVSAGLKRPPSIKFKTFRTICSNLKKAVNEMDVVMIDE